MIIKYIMGVVERINLLYHVIFVESLVKTGAEEKIGIR